MILNLKVHGMALEQSRDPKYGNVNSPGLHKA